MTAWRSRLMWVWPVGCFAGFLALRYFGVDPFPEMAGAVLAPAGAIALPLVLWWLAGDWKPSALCAPELARVFAPTSVYRGWLESWTLVVVAAELAAGILMLGGLTWGLVKTYRRGIWRRFQ
jgi:hypothetical protein